MTFELITTLLVLATPSPPDVAPAAPAAEPGSPAAAEVLFQGGVRAYDAREYGAAKELFERAYALSHIPEILYDIGLTYRALGECERAVASFDTFVKVAPPGDPLLVRARARMQDLGSCAGPVAEAPAAPATSERLAVSSEPLALHRDVTAVTPPVLVATASASPAPRTPPRAAQATQWAAAAAGGGSLALALSGAILGMRAHSLSETVDQSPVWTPQVQQEDAQGRAYDRAATALLVSAGATALLAAAAYGVSLWLSHSARAP